MTKEEKNLLKYLEEGGCLDESPFGDVKILQAEINKLYNTILDNQEVSAIPIWNIDKDDDVEDVAILGED